MRVCPKIRQDLIPKFLKYVLLPQKTLFETMKETSCSLYSNTLYKHLKTIFKISFFKIRCRF